MLFRSREREKERKKERKKEREKERKRKRDGEKAGRGEPARAACGDLDSAAAALVESVLQVLRLRGVTLCQGCRTKPRKAAVIAGAELAVKAIVLIALFMSRAHGLRPL